MRCKLETTENLKVEDTRTENFQSQVTLQFCLSSFPKQWEPSGAVEEIVEETRAAEVTIQGQGRRHLGIIDWSLLITETEDVPKYWIICSKWLSPMKSTLLKRDLKNNMYF